MPPILFTIPGIPHYFVDHACNIWSTKPQTKYAKPRKIPVKLATFLAGTHNTLSVNLVLPGGLKKHRSVRYLAALVFLGEPPKPTVKAMLKDITKPVSPSNLKWGGKNGNPNKAEKLLCREDGCDRFVKTMHLCGKHYGRKLYQRTQAKRNQGVDYSGLTLPLPGLTSGFVSASSESEYV